MSDHPYDAGSGPVQPVACPWCLSRDLVCRHLKLDANRSTRTVEELTAVLLRVVDQTTHGLRDQEQELTRLRAENTSLRHVRDGEVWVWQGDSEDHLDSLTCHVLIAAADLRALLVRSGVEQEPVPPTPKRDYMKETTAVAMLRGAVSAFDDAAKHGTPDHSYRDAVLLAAFKVGRA